MVMARQRERVFSLSRFTTMAEEDAQEETQAAYSRIYGASPGLDKPNFGSVDLGEINLEDDTEYVEPRTSYPTQVGIVGFNQVQKSVLHNADKYDDDFA